MDNVGETELLRLLKEGKGRILRDDIEKAIELLNTVLSDLRIPALQTRLEEIAKDLSDDRFRIIVCGRFKTGKSTLLNALLGRPETSDFQLVDEGFLPSHYLPATAVLTDVIYSPAMHVRVERNDLSTEDWTFTRFRNESTVRTSDQETKTFFSNIRRFEIGYPATLLEKGRIVVTDSPGTADMAYRDLITKEAVGRSDVAIVVLSTNQLAGEDERAFIRDIRDAGTTIFSVINLFGRPIDSSLINYTWERLTVMQNFGGKTETKDFKAKKIFFIDALTARRGRWEGRDGDVKLSGITEFEEALGTFLDRDRIKAHAGKYLSETQMLASSARLALLKQESNHRLEAEEIEKLIEKIRPRLEALQQQRNVLKLTFDKYQNICENVAKDTLSISLEEFRKAISGKIRNAQISSLTYANMIATVCGDRTTARVISDDIYSLFSKFLEENLKEWSDPNNEKGLQYALKPRMLQLAAELEEQITKISNQLSALRREGAGLTGTSEIIVGGVSLKTAIEQRMEAIAGQRLGAGAAIGGALAGALVVVIGTTTVNSIALALATAIGTFLSPTLLIGILIVALTGLGAGASTFGLKDKIKEEAAHQLAMAISLNREFEAEIAGQVANSYRASTDPIEKLVSAEIRAEEESLELLIREKQFSHKEKEVRLSQLNKVGLKLADAESRLTLARRNLDVFDAGLNEEVPPN
ncbi:dynamin family protein [Rhodomicrobium sp. Az07]|uniref:dynamin family protein n=1 Tax=Rhodomicrobium sp. Az07 TaxID=2839034 RepID=UPI001BEBD1A1|nr:dynamin family protein [Rhodomicrobium sp. Az07]MBT3072043.1 dynamin family protein [Rhodomicrobium sp. Az07]